MLIYRNTADLCILILHPEASLNLLVLKLFAGSVSGFSTYKIMSSANEDNFTFFFFSIWRPFLSFSCLSIQARTMSSMLNRNDESGHCCLVPDLRGKTFTFSPLSGDDICGKFKYDFYFSELISFQS